MTIRAFEMTMFCGLLTASACVANVDKQQESERLPSLGTPRDDFRFNDDPFSAHETLPSSLTEALTFGDANDGESLWALAQCGCLPTERATLFQRFATAQGALPQVLMPAVREQIRNDSALSVLISLPDFFGDPLERIFASDDKIAEEVRAKLSTRLATATNGIELKDHVAFRFDGFASPTSAKERSFTLADTALRWNLVMATGNVWNGDAPLAFGTHALQVLESLRILAEWKYLFGLDHNSATQSHYGGLTFDIEHAPTDPLKRFDPRDRTPSGSSVARIRWPTLNPPPSVSQSTSKKRGTVHTTCRG